MKLKIEKILANNVWDNVWQDVEIKNDNIIKIGKYGEALGIAAIESFIKYGFYKSDTKEEINELERFMISYVFPEVNFRSVSYLKIE